MSQFIKTITKGTKPGQVKVTIMNTNRRWMRSALEAALDETLVLPKRQPHAHEDKAA
jgi:hypothetical protein